MYNRFPFPHTSTQGKCPLCGEEHTEANCGVQPGGLGAWRAKPEATGSALAGDLHEQLADLLGEVYKQEKWEREHPFTMAVIKERADDRQ